jgi:hypothetical protein
VTNATQGAESYATLSASITSFSAATAPGVPVVTTCSASDYSVNGNAVGVTSPATGVGSITVSGTPVDLAAGAHNSASTVTVQMIDSGSNQNACENLLVNLTIVAA